MGVCSATVVLSKGWFYVDKAIRLCEFVNLVKLLRRQLDLKFAMDIGLELGEVCFALIFRFLVGFVISSGMNFYYCWVISYVVFPCLK